MKQTFLYLAFAVFAAVSLASCSKVVIGEEQEEVGDRHANSTLVVRAATVSGSDGTATISYPVNVYVFNSSGTCVALSTITGADDDITFKLIGGGV